MGKVKAKILMDEFDQAFPTTQNLLFEGLVENGWLNTTLQQKKPLEQDGNGAVAGNNFFSPSTTATTSSAVSKPEILILNGQAKPNITTKEKKAKAGQFTKIPFDLEHQKKMMKALEAMKMFYATDTPLEF